MASVMQTAAAKRVPVVREKGVGSRESFLLDAHSKGHAGWSLTSVCGPAHGEARGQAARGSKRGLWVVLCVCAKRSGRNATQVDPARFSWRFETRLHSRRAGATFAPPSQRAFHRVSKRVQVALGVCTASNPGRFSARFETRSDGWQAVWCKTGARHASHPGGCLGGGVCA
jgi:hypothetical protein